MKELDELREISISLPLRNGDTLKIRPWQRKIGVFVDMTVYCGDEYKYNIQLQRSDVVDLIKGLAEINNVAEEIAKIVFQK